MSTSQRAKQLLNLIKQREAQLLRQDVLWGERQRLLDLLNRKSKAVDDNAPLDSDDTDDSRAPSVTHIEYSNYIGMFFFSVGTPRFAKGMMNES